ncbi:MAG: heavy-metal-associated domain-containing protein [Parcubacteria group bacterium]|nr:heavy-metal-associated domain-containing protein [Parcubacteria group bacterium]
MTKTDMHIEGMHCGACATGIQMLVSGMDGVASVFVDYEGKKGTFEFDESKVSLDKIKSEIATLGYTAS